MKGLKFVFGVVTLFFGLVLFANLNCFSTQSDLIEEEDFQQEVDLQASVGSNSYASANVGKKPISMDYYNMAYLNSSGYLYASGDNGNGELGNGGTTDVTTPFALYKSGSSSNGYFQNPKDYSFSGANSAVVASDGTLWAAGWNFVGQNANNNESWSDQTFEQARYSASSYVTNAVAVSVGNNSTLMMNSSGQLYGTGTSTSYGATSQVYFTKLFTRIDNNTTYFTSAMTSKTVKDFGVGSASSFILFTDGTLYGCYSSSGFKLIDSGVTMIDNDSVSNYCFYLKSDGMYSATVSSASDGGVVTKSQRVSMTSTVSSSVVQIRGYDTSRYGYLTSSGALYVTDTTYGGAGISTATATGVAYFDLGEYTFGYVTSGGVFCRWGYGSYGALGNGSTDNVLFSDKVATTIGISYIPPITNLTLANDISNTPPA